MPEGILGSKDEAYYNPYYDSSEKGIEVHRVLRYLEGGTVMRSDAVWEGCSLWFPLAKES